MAHFAVVARLRPGTEELAHTLVAEGPPFDLAAAGVDRHQVFLSYGEVVFVFEGEQVEWAIDDVVDRPFRHPAFDRWKPLLEGTPRLAREVFTWQRD